MKKRSILLVLALLLAMPAMASAQEPVSLSYWVKMEGGTVARQYISTYAEHTAYMEREKRSGIHIEWEHPAIGQENEQFNLMIVSGNIPDMVADVNLYYSGGSLTAIADGLFLDVTDLLAENAPNLCALMEMNPQLKKELYSDDGVFIGFPMITVGSDQTGESVMPGPLSPWGGPMIRADWLRQAGLETPTTIDEWYAALTAIKEAVGPDVLLEFSTEETAAFESRFACFLGAYNVGPGFYQADGQVKFGPVEEGFRAYLTEMNRWYAEGLIDKEFATRDGESMTALRNNGKVAASWRQAVSFINAQKAFDNEWVATEYPTLEKGVDNLWRYSNTIARGHVTLISAKCENVEECIRWLDYGYSLEGARLMCFGVEGLDYDGYNELGQPNYVDKYLENGGAGFATYASVFRLSDGTFLRISNEICHPTYFDPEMYAIPQLWMGPTDYVLPAVSLTTAEAMERGAIMTDVQTYVNEMTAKFIMGIETLDHWDGYVKTIRSMGLDTALAITQEAMDRYLAR